MNRVAAIARDLSRVYKGHLSLFAVIFVVSVISNSANAQYFNLGKGNTLEFYDVDYSQAPQQASVDALALIHHISLQADSDGAYLSLGGELREQMWGLDEKSYGLNGPPRVNDYVLQRALLGFYLHLNDHIAIFVQPARYDAFGEIGPKTTDESDGRLQQAFLELKGSVASAFATIRVGRQEIALGSTRFVWINDSSNVRTTHDGVRVKLDFGDTTSLDFAFTRPVTPTYGAFNDFNSHSGTFGEAYLTQTVIPHILNIDGYYYYRDNPAAQYLTYTGDERRDTVGGRLWGAVDDFKYDSDVAYQFGTFENREISAVGMSTRVLYTFEDEILKPGVQFQGSYFSGSNSSDGTISTFSAPMPRPTSLNYIGLNTLENLIEAYPALLVQPAPDFTFRFGPESLWRASNYDAVYISRTTPLTKTISNTDQASYIGTNLIATLQWTPIEHVVVFGEFLHQLAGPAITQAGGRPAEAGELQVDLQL